MDNIIVKAARLHCSAEQAFAYFTDNDLLQRWLTNLADVQPEVGGKYELFWFPDDPGYNSTLGCKITALIPNTLLAFEWKGPPQHRCMNEIDPLTHVTVFFTPCNEVLTPCTDIYLVHTGWGHSEDWEDARTYFAWSWESALGGLESLANDPVVHHSWSA